jgi:Protein of unknown function (DUF2914)
MIRDCLVSSKFPRPRKAPARRLAPAVWIVAFFVAALFSSAVYPQAKKAAAPPVTPKRLELEKAVMCEEVKDLVPQNPAVAFSITLGKVSCFTTFDPVPEKAYIYHNWYYRDRLSTRIRLFIQPPRWSTFSTIYFRDTDRGPWRVEVTDKNGKVLRTLRFSVTE